MILTRNMIEVRRCRYHFRPAIRRCRSQSTRLAQREASTWKQSITVDTEHFLQMHVVEIDDVGRFIHHD